MKGKCPWCGNEDVNTEATVYICSACNRRWPLSATPAPNYDTYENCPECWGTGWIMSGYGPKSNCQACDGTGMI